MDIIKKDEFRFYSSAENKEQMKPIFKKVINILDKKVLMKKMIYNVIKTKAERLTLDGNIKTGYIDVIKRQYRNMTYKIKNENIMEMLLNNKGGNL